MTHYQWQLSDTNTDCWPGWNFPEHTYLLYCCMKFTRELTSLSPPLCTSCGETGYFGFYYLPRDMSIDCGVLSSTMAIVPILAWPAS